ncbi:hypothetical protein [Kineosporia babensis]|uniref:Uncharacterized protein n=1 Tax=Kineosporia babensis TaxID=499548 RepID=A0A9X1NHS9_9ACTN|nr:hypothetical protein [Kineosporia babensis]MCD5313521.1 hypothetical protein [Kineosporia babensis]
MSNNDFENEVAPAKRVPDADDPAGNTEQLPVDAPGATRKFELDQTRSFEAEATDVAGGVEPAGSAEDAGEIEKDTADKSGEAGAKRTFDPIVPVNAPVPSSNPLDLSEPVRPGTTGSGSPDPAQFESTQSGVTPSGITPPGAIPAEAASPGAASLGTTSSEGLPSMPTTFSGGEPADQTAAKSAPQEPGTKPAKPTVEEQAAAFIAAENPAPAFRPENESETGFVGYITSKRGPQMPPQGDAARPQAPQFTPADNPAPGAPVSAVAPPPPLGHPGIRIHTVVIGLILLAIGLSTLVSQLSGISVNPGAVILAIMLGVGVTLMSAAIKRSQKSRA